MLEFIINDKINLKEWVYTQNVIVSVDNDEVSYIDEIYERILDICGSENLAEEICNWCESAGERGLYENHLFKISACIKK